MQFPTVPISDNSRLLTAVHVIRAILIEQLFSSFFSHENQEKQRKQEIFSNFGNLTEGDISGTLSIPIFGGENGKSGGKKKNSNLFFFGNLGQKVLQERSLGSAWQFLRPLRILVIPVPCCFYFLRL